MSESEIIEFLSGWGAAEVAGDAAALGGYLAEDFTGVGPLGFTLSKEDWLSRHETSALTYTSFDVTEPSVRLYGDTAVVIATQQVDGAYQGHPIPSQVRVTIVVVKPAGQWQLAGVHSSFIAGTPGAPPIPGR
ncbi:nuclear transport factor 2 family protein [Amycolatopsis nigrescens]|uniref:nuclear transport factor 2 family protein n=1 Tax=Amycolatopsis nigrescens TaxID=381445 RepID=UPI00036BEE7E|nr:nuclear transport factor 2 family protein [Amycolatopsis nigrescens]